MRSANGFTLIELVITMAVASILMAISIPPVIQWRQTQQLNSATQQVLSVIQDIRLYAVKENANARIQFTENSDSYQILKWKREAGAPVSRSLFLPPGITITTTTFDSETLIYNSRGMTEDASGNLGGGGAVTIRSSDGRSLVITVPSVGPPRIS